MRVVTTDQNVFYTNTETKSSVWTVPDEIKVAVRQLEQEEIRSAEKAKRIAEEEQAAKALEARLLYEAEQKRIMELEVQKVRAEVEAEAQLRGLKRKPDDFPSALPMKSSSSSVAAGEGARSLERQTKAQKLDESADQDEEWQRQIAEEMALEAEEENTVAVPQVQPTLAVLPMPTIAIPTGLSTEELKATFKVDTRSSSASDLMADSNLSLRPCFSKSPSTRWRPGIMSYPSLSQIHGT